jgi:putative GTP pyrophosphokinase
MGMSLAKRRPLRATTTQISRIVDHFVANERRVSGFLNAVLAHINQSKDLQSRVHSIKHRIKDPEHLREKLTRKAREAWEARKPFKINPDNLLRKVTDLAGIRILHLHTSQFSGIDSELRSIFDEQKFRLIEGPFARTWDDEYREFFKALGVKPQKSPTLYTSVHYVIASGSQTTVTCEIQVRTLMEEVWGEVDHTINYPHPANDVSCREQIRALARATSSATRLVDSIFATIADIEEQKAKKKKSD